MIPQNYTGVSSMVAPPLSQTNYIGIPSKIYHFNRQKVDRSSKTGSPGCTDNPTRLNRAKKKTDPVRVFSPLFKVDPRACPIKSYRCTALNQYRSRFLARRLSCHQMTTVHSWRKLSSYGRIKKSCK